MDLDGKVAIVTGASRGIGKAVALKLAMSGANIVINYAHNQQAAKETGKAIELLGRKVLLVEADVSFAEQADKLVLESISKFGKVDILINNAGITKDNLLLRMKEEEWDAVIDTNLKGVYNCTKAVIKAMLKQKSGKIVNVSSVVGLIGNSGQANYAAAKAGIIGFSKSIAREVASRGININVVAPGFIETEMTSSFSQEAKKVMLDKIPLARLGKPEDVAETVKFLVSPAADYITGQTLAVDGGMVMA